MNLEPLELILILVELVVLGYVVTRARAIYRVFRRERPKNDFLRALRLATAEVTGGHRVVEIVIFELAMLHYAFSWGGPGREGADDALAFTSYQRSGYGQLLAGLGLVAALELALVHWLVFQYWRPAAAWVLTALGLYGCLFFLADFKACRRRPILLTGDRLVVRIGLRWDLDITFGQIQAFRRPERRETAKGKTSLKAVVRGQPDFVFELTEPLLATGAYGRRRKVDRVYLQVDDREAFEAALTSRLAAVA